MKLSQHIPKANILNHIWLMNYLDTPRDSISIVVCAEFVKLGILA